jgi:cell wall-associated NlpC family hydrolase
MPVDKRMGFLNKTLIQSMNQSILLKIWLRMTACLLFILIIGCSSASSKIPPYKDSDIYSTQSKSFPAPAQPRMDSSRSLENRLRSEVRKWRGTPHKMGGTGSRGVDCSGFVQHIYRDVFQRTIPRSTALQVKTGRPINPSNLHAGDLIFFKPPYKKFRHVGIYLGRGEFAHASTNKGVIISSLSEDYWQECYWTARRYLTD